MLMKRKNIIVAVIIVLVLIVCGAGAYMYPKYKAYKAFMATETVQLDNKLTAVLGGGGNSVILITDSAVVVIDTKMKDKAEELFIMAKEKAGNKKIIVINTHYHMDHTGGNPLFKGDKILIGNYDKAFLEKNLKPEEMPTDFIKDSLILNLGDETVALYNLGQAHTFDDVVVYLKNRKVFFSGDLVFDKVNPVLKRESGADVDKWVGVLNKILNSFDIKTLVPGHGKVGNKNIAMNLKNYFEDMKIACADASKIADMKEKYADWKSFPNMASVDITIEYIKSSHK